jgi:hypothetical protein
MKDIVLETVAKYPRLYTILQAEKGMVGVPFHLLSMAF